MANCKVSFAMSRMEKRGKPSNVQVMPKKTQRGTVKQTFPRMPSPSSLAKLVSKASLEEMETNTVMESPSPPPPRSATPKLPAGPAQKDSPIPPGTVMLEADGFVIDYGRAKEYAERVRREIENGEPYSLSKGQEVYKEFMVPSSQCVFWEKYTFEKFLGNGKYGVVLGFSYMGKKLAVKVQMYEDTFMEMAHEIGINAIIAQLPEEKTFGLIKMYDWARCHFNLSEKLPQGTLSDLPRFMGREENAFDKPRAYQLIVFDQVGDSLETVFFESVIPGRETVMYEFWGSVLLQVLATQFYLFRTIEFRHLDLHWNNIFTKRKPEGKTHILYKIELDGGIRAFRVPLEKTNNLIMVIGDFGRSIATVPGVNQTIGHIGELDADTFAKETRLDLFYAQSMPTMMEALGVFETELLQRIMKKDARIIGNAVSMITEESPVVPFEYLFREMNVLSLYEIDDEFAAQDTDILMEIMNRDPRAQNFTEIKAARGL